MEVLPRVTQPFEHASQRGRLFQQSLYVLTLDEIVDNDCVVNTIVNVHKVVLVANRCDRERDLIDESLQHEPLPVQAILHSTDVAGQIVHAVRIVVRRGSFVLPQQFIVLRVDRVETTQFAVNVALKVDERPYGDLEHETCFEHAFDDPHVLDRPFVLDTRDHLDRTVNDERLHRLDGLSSLTALARVRLDVSVSAQRLRQVDSNSEHDRVRVRLVVLRALQLDSDQL